MEDTRKSVETDGDVIAAPLSVETPSPSRSGSGSPRVEVVVMEEEADYEDGPPVTIIGDNDDDVDDLEDYFPDQREGETKGQAIARAARYLQFGNIPMLMLVAVD